MNLFETLYAGRAPGSAALRLPAGEVITTAKLADGAGRWAGALASLGVRRGDRVSFKLEKSPEVLMLAHGCLMMGAVLHPMNTAYSDSEIELLLQDAAPAIFIGEEDERDRLAQVARRAGVAFESFGAGGSGALARRVAAARPPETSVDVGGDDIAAILYTSGTTGRPKGACITHGNLAQSALALARVWSVREDDVLLHALPIYHAHGLLTSVDTMLVAGASILFLPRFEAAEVVAALPAATMMMGVPTHYGRLLREPGFGADAAARLRLVISGSAPLPEELAARFFERTGRRITERYGSTEAAIVTAVPAGTERPGWVGWPLPGVDVRVAAEDGTLAERAGVGVLQTRGHNIFAGYWNAPEADAAAFTSDGWFVTGDIAEIDAEGCVRLLGRTSDLIISGGLNVYPREVEAVLDRIPGVAESAVFGVAHPDFGEAVVAVVRLEPGAALDEAATITTAKDRLAAYKAPKRVVAIDEIPRNRMGKTLKTQLKQRFGDLFQAPS